MSKESNLAYHSDMSRVSNSMLTVLKRSSKEFDKRFNLKKWIESDSKPLRIGNMVHCLTLEPTDFENRYIVAEKHDRRTNVGKAAWAEFEARAEGLEIVDADEVKLAIDCAKELIKHDQFGSLLASPPSDAVIEERIDFEWNGVAARCKPDMLIPSMRLMLDVKTTQDASPEVFAKAVAKWGYARQHAFYCEAARQKYGFDFRFLLCVVSTNQAMETACYELSPKSVAIAKTELDNLVAEYSRRKNQMDWVPVYSSGIIPLDLPKYYNPNILVDEDEESEELEGVAA